MQEFHYKATEEQEEERIDKCIAGFAEPLSRSYAQKLIKEGQVLVNGKNIKPNYIVKTDDEILLFLPEAAAPSIEPEDIPLSVLYEDEDVLVVDKQKGMVIHPAAGHYSGTLVNAVLYHCRGNLSGINGIMRPGIVHRIDMNTTGSVIVCKNDLSHREIAAQLKNHSITRKYRAIVFGLLKDDKGCIDAPIGRHPNDRKKMSVHCKTGKNAVTHYQVLRRFRSYTYIECELETGRTHQIRVHMASIGHPLLGDSVYTNQKSPWPLQGQTLHAMTLGFLHPSTHQYLEVTAPLPQYFADLLHKLGNS